MTADPYRPPGAPLRDPNAPPEPRSAVIAVALAIAAMLGFGLVVVAGVAVLGLPLETVERPGAVAVLSTLTGLVGGATAARYRRGRWPGVCLALIAIDLAIAGWVHATGSARLSPPVAVLDQIVSAGATLAGGYAARRR